MEQRWQGKNPHLHLRGQEMPKSCPESNLQPEIPNTEIPVGFWLNLEFLQLYFVLILELTKQISSVSSSYIFHESFFQFSRVKCQVLFLDHLTGQIIQPSRRLSRELTEEPYKFLNREKKGEKTQNCLLSRHWPIVTDSIGPIITEHHRLAVLNNKRWFPTVSENENPRSKRSKTGMWYRHEFWCIGSQLLTDSSSGKEWEISLESV